jgi:hypothetical protein
MNEIQKLLKKLKKLEKEYDKLPEACVLDRAKIEKRADKVQKKLKEFGNVSI